MKPLVLYHAFCNDGFGAAFAAWKHFGPSGADYVPVQYGNFDFPTSGGVDVGKSGNAVNHPIEDRDVYVLDFSFTQAMTDRIMDVSSRFVWLDHHKTAFEEWLKQPPEACTNERWICQGPDSGLGPKDHVIWLDNNRSGALLAWDFFHPHTEAPVLIKHLDDYDRWQFKLPNTKAVDRAVRTYDFDFGLWDRWCERWRQDPSTYGTFVKEGEAIQRFYARQVENAVAATKRPVLIRAPLTAKTTGLYSGLAANLPSAMASDAGHLLAKESGTFGLTWYQPTDRNSMVNLSFRAIGDYDVSAIARVFGGGGHRSSAGASVSLETLQSWMVPSA